MEMRASKVLRKLRAGQLVSCVKLNLGDPRAAEIAAMCGFDSIWLDMEHVPGDWSNIENQVRAAKIYDADAMVRVPRGSYSDYIKPLELDASGIMVPHLMSAADARDVVWKTRFHPVGRRAVDGGNTDGAYCMIDFKEYIKRANEQRFVVVQIEDPEPLEELDEIAKVEGINMIFFGPGDFSHGTGKPGEFDSREISDTRRRIATVCKEHGKYAGTVGSVENLAELREMGYSFISLGADVIALGDYFRKIVEAFGQYKKE